MKHLTKVIETEMPLSAFPNPVTAANAESPLGQGSLPCPPGPSGLWPVAAGTIWISALSSLQGKYLNPEYNSPQAHS